MDIIQLKDALAEMKNGNPFSISFVTLDENRKKGGEVLSFQKCMIPSAEVESLNEKGFELPTNKTDRSTSPKHYENATRNILLENGHIKKLHIRLMLSFNDKKVFY